MITISKAKPSECQEIRKFEIQTWQENVTSPYDAAFYTYFGYCFVAKDEDKIVGLIMAFKTKDDRVKIVDWLIDDHYRRQGLGTRLYERLKKEVAPLPIIAFVDCTNIVSLNRHLNLGFQKIRKMKDPFYLNDGSEWWYMEYKSAPSRSFK